MCTCVCASVCAYMHVVLIHACTCSHVHVFLNCSPHYLLRQGLSQSLMGICLSPLPSAVNTTDFCLHLVCLMYAKDRTQRSVCAAGTFPTEPSPTPRISFRRPPPPLRWETAAPMPGDRRPHAGNPGSGSFCLLILAKSETLAVNRNSWRVVFTVLRSVCLCFV